MSLRGLQIHPVGIITPAPDTSYDRYGNPTETDGPTVGEVWRIEPTGTAEDLIDRDTRVNAYRGFAPPTSVVTALSRVAWGAKTLRVDGEPQLFYGRRGKHHYEVALAEVSG